MPHGYDHSETSVYYMNYHFVWCPKYRRPVLVSEVRDRLEELIKKKCEEMKSEILSLSIASDHIHLFVKTDPRIAPNRFIGLIKGYTSHELRNQFPDLRKKTTYAMDTKLFRVHSWSCVRCHDKEVYRRAEGDVR